MLSSNLLLGAARFKCSAIFKRTFSSVKAVQIIATEKVNPNVRIVVDSKHNLIIKPYDLLDCPDGNLLRVSSSGTSQNIMDIIHLNANVIEIKSNLREGEDDCDAILEVPVKSDLNIRSLGNVDVSNMFNEMITIESTKNIRTKNLNSSSILLKSSHGNIECAGITLGQTVEIATQTDGKIHLHRMQGEQLLVSSESGEIKTNSCYTTDSTFKTRSGDLDLKNIHKCCKVEISEDGNLNMNGFNGNLSANIHGSGEITMQLSEIIGESHITCCSDAKEATINLAERILANCHVRVFSKEIKFNETLAELRPQESNITHKQIEHGDPSNTNKLTIQTKGKLHLGKMSWEENFKLNFTSKT